MKNILSYLKMSSAIVLWSISLYSAIAGNWQMDITATVTGTVYDHDIGNSASSARFSWTPALTDYSRSLWSKVFTGSGVTQLFLDYNLQIDDFGSTDDEHLSVEVRIAGGNWVTLKDYINIGDIPWMNEEIHI